MNGKVLGAALLGFVALKVVSRHHGMAGGYGPRRGFRPDGTDPRRQWIVDFHRSLHEADEAEASGTTAGTAGDASPSTNPATAD
jgi:hypothetical protein